jgi:ATP synthase F1 complex assembly factor 2
VYIKPHTMPLMHLATLALDQVPVQRESMVSNMLGYIHTDSACIRDKELPSLVRLQYKHWDPVVQWMSEKLGEEVQVTPEHSCSVNIVQQTPAVVAKIEAILDNMSDWELATLDSLTAISKSICVSLAVLEGQLDVKKGYECSRLEENFQMRRYGRVDGVFGHGIDIEYVRMKTAAARTFINLLSLSDPKHEARRNQNSTNESERAQRDLDSTVRNYDMSF